MRERIDLYHTVDCLFCMLYPSGSKRIHCTLARMDNIVNVTVQKNNHSFRICYIHSQKKITIERAENHVYTLNRNPGILLTTHTTPRVPSIHSKGQQP